VEVLVQLHDQVFHHLGQNLDRNYHVSQALACCHQHDELFPYNKWQNKKEERERERERVRVRERERQTDRQRERETDRERQTKDIQIWRLTHTHTHIYTHIHNVIDHRNVPAMVMGVQHKPRMEKFQTSN
jgi:hypothetical protein